MSDFKLTCESCLNEIKPSEYKVISFQQPGNEKVINMDVCNDCFNRILEQNFNNILLNYRLN